ncbi:MAG: serpin family protein [Sedimentisphaerales bacterium]|nr:serpin family protein [Sedimentisphaerales bacterium]
MKNVIIKISLLCVILSLFTTGAFAGNGSGLITQGNNVFALNLYSQIKDLSEVKQAEGNLFFSPYSISTALAMTYTGARGNTAREMADVLRLPSIELDKITSAFGDLQKHLQAEKETSGYQLNVANALWGQKGYPFLSEFIGTNKKYFGSGLTELDFAKSEEARKIINTWVEEKTNDKIKDLIPAGAIDAMTRLVLTNAIYFKGDWSIKFKEENTKESDFHVTEQKTAKVQMMYQKESFEYAQLDNMQILQMPYKGDELSMLIILPKTIGDMDKIESDLNSSEILQSNIKQMRKREVDVYLPKFKMTCGSIDITKILSQMGMKEAFSNNADFSGMSERKDLFISNVLHKAFVEVNEEGTEAAAATAVVMKMLSIPSPPSVFRADRPFIFMIRDNATQSILFIGRVVNPTSEG